MTLTWIPREQADLWTECRKCEDGIKVVHRGDGYYPDGTCEACNATGTIPVPLPQLVRWLAGLEVSCCSDKDSPWPDTNCPWVPRFSSLRRKVHASGTGACWDKCRCQSLGWVPDDSLEALVAAMGQGYQLRAQLYEGHEARVIYEADGEVQATDWQQAPTPQHALALAIGASVLPMETPVAIAPEEAPR